jgi:putative transposase
MTRVRNGCKVFSGAVRPSQHEVVFPPIAQPELEHPQFTDYPGLAIERSNQVWVMDICYIPMRQGLVYLAAVMDWCSRRILAWRLSNSLTTDFCSEAVEEAIAHHGRPELFNSDQGSQFTDSGFVALLAAPRDNVFVERFWRSIKYEEVYLHAYDSIAEANKFQLRTLDR